MTFWIWLSIIIEQTVRSNNNICYSKYHFNTSPKKVNILFTLVNFGLIIHNNIIHNTTNVLQNIHTHPLKYYNFEKCSCTVKIYTNTSLHKQQARGRPFDILFMSEFSYFFHFSNSFFYHFPQSFYFFLTFYTCKYLLDCE